MLKLATLAAISATAVPAATLTPNEPWWERVTMTMTADGTTHSCRLVTSLAPDRGEACDATDAAGAAPKAPSSSAVFTRITFERRFSPGERPDLGEMQPGDKRLGTQVLSLGIDEGGAVRSCRVVAAMGDVLPAYGCREAGAERFEASTASAAALQQGFMTIIVYGHSEQLV